MYGTTRLSSFAVHHSYRLDTRSGRDRYPRASLWLCQELVTLVRPFVAVEVFVAAAAAAWREPALRFEHAVGQEQMQVHYLEERQDQAHLPRLVLIGLQMHVQLLSYDLRELVLNLCPAGLLVLAVFGRPVFLRNSRLHHPWVQARDWQGGRTKKMSRHRKLQLLVLLSCHESFSFVL